jgi:methionyl-tRNA synthetase
LAKSLCLAYNKKALVIELFCMTDHSFYITTTLPYVNSEPHLGFAAEIVHADILARFYLTRGKQVFFNTGTDEHGLKIYRKAQESGQDPQAYVDKYAAKFKELKDVLGLLPELHFIRTTDAHHKAAAQEFWKRCLANGDIYKKAYQVKYCVGCELEKTDSELEDSKCPIHPNLVIELIDEENYFFRFSKFQESLLKFYEANPGFVVPNFRFKEIKSFVSLGLQDFSISRLKEKMPWGVLVPGDNAQVMYVWFDALISYISTLGWPEDGTTFEKFWPGLQIAGKDNLRQQSAMWQAMLMSAGLPNSKQIIIRGFIGVDGQKMSKSLGNVINPVQLVDAWGSEAVRYFIARELNPFEDSDFTESRFKASYTAGLVNGLGNTVSRILKMAVSYKVPFPEYVSVKEAENDLIEIFETRDIQRAAEHIWRQLADLDKFIQTREPFKTIKTNPEQAKIDITTALEQLYSIARQLRAFLPQTADKIFAFYKAPTPDIPHLFPRLT